ncbi:hypothetical protein ACO34A_19650 [Rhizobium sp. ACO-34A]|nr:hypothetical protein [Rhizobium sp. ACO-34A]ATN36020.1 hypothetical protein ACO34A_19650 [Rhizobium sp. ACO-34A]
MLKLIATSLLATVMISTARADDRMDAYTTCWANTATSELNANADVALELSIPKATDVANTRCNKLAREAAKTNGKEAVNDMWRYMEAQFANANFREAGGEDTQPVPTASTSQWFDFKGIVVGAPATPRTIKQKLGVDCGAGYAGMQVCNGTVTIAGVIADMNLVISKTGKVQRISLSFNSKFYEQVEDAMFKKFGKPGVNLTSEVQNGYGAKFIQRELLWGDTPNTVAMMKYANKVTDSFIMFSSAEETAMRSTRDQSSDL